MTVSNETSRIQYDGDDVTVQFVVPFYFYKDADVQVWLSEDETESELVLSTDYDISGAGETSSRWVTCYSAPTANQHLTILRSTEYTQETDYKPFGRIPADTLEYNIDKLTMLCQDNLAIISRTPKLPITTINPDTTIEEPIAGNYLRYDDDLNISNGGIASGVPLNRVINTENGLQGGDTLDEDITLSPVYGEAENTVCEGDDDRLSDARVPLGHVQNMNTIGLYDKTIAYGASNDFGTYSNNLKFDYDTNTLEVENITFDGALTGSGAALTSIPQTAVTNLSTQLADVITKADGNEGDITTLQSTKLNYSEKGASAGVATLDGTAKLTQSQIPDFVDITASGKVAIGHETAATALDVRSDGDDSTKATISSFLYSDSASILDSGYVTAGRGRGTQASPDYLNSGDTMGIYAFSSYGGTATPRIVEAIRGYATEDHSATQYGSGLQLYTTANGDTNPSLCVDFNQDCSTEFQSIVSATNFIASAGGTAFNKDFGGTGDAITVARSNHTHDYSAVYEPIISTKNTAFNKDFAGTGSATTVAKSDHTHDYSAVYEPIISTKNTAFNKSFAGTGVSTLVAKSDHDHNSTYLALTGGAIDGDVTTTGDFSACSSSGVDSFFNIGPDNLLDTLASDFCILMGRNNTVNGASSIAIGEYCVSSAYRTIAIGGFNEATNTSACSVGGESNDATGSYSITAGGKTNVASGDYSTICGGQNNKAQGATSAILGGYQNTVAGIYSTILGGTNNASSENYNVILGGMDNEASGRHSISGGQGSSPTTLAETSLGRFGLENPTGGENSWRTTDIVFGVGIGTYDGNRANAISVYKSGDATITGTLTATTFSGSGASLTDNARFLTSSQKTDLTDGGDSTSHYHSSDRSASNITGTLAIANGGTGRTDITTTEYSYLDNVTSNIQNQLDGKLSLTGGALTGALTATSFIGSGASLTLIPQSAVTDLTTDLGDKVDTTDGRLSDARTPLTHDQSYLTVTAEVSLEDVGKVLMYGSELGEDNNIKLDKLDWQYVDGLSDELDDKMNIVSGTTDQVLTRTGTGDSDYGWADASGGVDTTSLPKTLAVTTSWTDADIDGTDLATGSYTVQVNIGNEYFTGVMSWYSGATTDTNGVYTEIVLHGCGASADNHIYLRVANPDGTAVNKIQITADTAISSTTVNFKFAKVI